MDVSIADVFASEDLVTRADAVLASQWFPMRQYRFTTGGSDNRSSEFARE